MKRIILIFLIALNHTSFSQEKSITFSSEINLETNAINGAIINEVFTSGHINNNLKNRIISLNEQSHVINLNLNTSFIYREKINNELSYSFSFSDVNHVNTKFDNNILKLFLKGNAEYENEKLDFATTNIRINRYQQFKLFLDYQKNKYGVGLALSYIYGNHNLTLISKRGSIYTAPNGEYLDLNYDINSFVTDTSNLSPFKHNGNGMSLDLTGSLTFLNHKLDLYMLDFGYINWNNNSQNIYVDSAFTFNGIEVNNIFDFNDSILEISNIVDQYDNINQRNSTFKSYLCSNIGVKISKQLKNKRFGMITYGLNSKWQPYLDNKKLSFKKIRQGFKQSNYSPFYYLTTEIITNKISIIPKIAYGGYNENFNFDLSLLLKRKFSFSLGTQHLEYLFSKELTRGFGIYFKIYTTL